VALIGIAGYLIIAILATVYRNQPHSAVLLLIASAIGMGFALYLAYVEKFILGAWCILCLTSLALISMEVALSAIAAINPKKQARV
jgi:uncharacterized membrane protein